MQDEACEVVVVGGGPAGSALAARLAEAGHDVLVLDRARFPRRKPCAECVNPAGVRALRALGAWEAVRAAEHAPLAGWRIGTGTGHAFDGGFPDGARGIAISRLLLDDVLLEHARARGAGVRTGARVVDVVRQGGRVAGVRLADEAGGGTIRARLVVGADGLRSVVVRRLGLLRRPPRLRKVGLTAHVEGFHGEPGRGEVRVSARGCLGIAAVSAETANVTVMAAGEEARAVGGDAGGYFDRALAEYGFPEVARVDEVLSTGPFDWPVRRAVADGALLVGDAAGYYDPFTGQGIYRALHGAELAARAAHAALLAGDLSRRGLEPYERARRRAFAPGERLQRVIEAFVARPALLGAVADRFARRPQLADAMVQATGDIRPAGSLFRPAFIAALLF
ncbi:MAG TPA: FAD-dependent monooxygenase [Longimicrobiaceae bacterium]|nr:FAD-dependent monooxygenase [Longimicrobiaceae bacterium]